MFSKLCGISCRVEMILLLLCGLIASSILRVISSVTVASPSLIGAVHWTLAQRGLFLSSMFWGYVVGQLPASLCTRVYGGKTMFALSTLGSGLLSLILPVAVSHSFSFALFVNSLIGLMTAIAFPCVYHYIAIWVPSHEKTVLIPCTVVGTHIGWMIGLGTSGALATTPCDIDRSGIGCWNLPYYLYGLIAIAWTPVWWMFAHETPYQHPNISNDELYIFMRDNKNKNTQAPFDSLREVVLSIPWKSLLTNKVALTCYFNSWTYGFILFLLMQLMPTYFVEVFGFNIRKSAALCIVPYIGLFAGTNLFSLLFGHLQARYQWQARTVRLVAQCIAFGGAGLVLFIVPFISQTYLAYSLIILSQVLLAAFNSGCACNYVEISPMHSSIMTTIGNVCASLAGVAALNIVSACANRWHGMTAWRAVFGIVFGKSLIALILWFLYQTSDIVPELNETMFKQYSTCSTYDSLSHDDMEASYILDKRKPKLDDADDDDEDTWVGSPLRFEIVENGN